MKNFCPNYKKKDYEKQISLINIEYKGKSTLKELMIRKLETSQEYELAVDNQDSKLPKGLELIMNNNIELMTKAYDQVIKIAYEFYNDSNNININPTRLTNYRFYVNTPYFDRNGSDPYPLFRLDDSRINCISELVLDSLKKLGLGLEDCDKDLLNIIVRIYKPGDILNFHTDRDIFGENIYGLVLYNSDPTRGLVIKTKKHSFMLEEIQGMIW
jgi:alkylated DNA repair dioxygenase AlkB